MTEGKRWRIVADYWAGEDRDRIAARYGCSPNYPGMLAWRRGFARNQPDTLRKPHRIDLRRRQRSAHA